MSASHCQWCADPWRAVLVGLMRKGARPSMVARYYGLRRTTITDVRRHAIEKGCLEKPRCTYCQRRIPGRRVICEREACAAGRDRDSSRVRRARFGKAGRVPDELRSRGRMAPPGMEWPQLPPSPRERTRREPREVLSPPVVHIASLFGVGNRRQEVRSAVVASYEAQWRPALPKSKAAAAITPFRPLASRAVGPGPMWLGTQPPAASGRLRPCNTFTTAPPLCPTIGTIPHARMAA